MAIILRRPRMFAIGLTALFALAFLAVLAALGPNWAAYAPASCTATRCFCELPRTGSLLLQPSNTWSSFGYVLVGCFLLVMPYDRDPGSALSPLSGRTLGVTSIIVGIGSGLLHATLTLWGQFFDVLGMYLVGSFLLISAIARWRKISDGAAVGYYVTLCGSLVAALLVFPESRRWLFAILLSAAIITELALARRYRPNAHLALYLGGLMATASAFGIWILDQQGLVCAPKSLLQGHAVWHILGAASLWLTLSYYRSERRQPPSELSAP